MPDTKAPLLEKAASVANHIARINKASGDFAEKMSAMHKAHQQDVNKALGQLGKVIGLDVAGSGPDPIDLEALGTENLQTFKTEISEFIKSEFAKLSATPPVVKAEREKKVCPTCDKSMADCTCGKATKAVDVTEESLNKLFEAQLTKMAELVKTQVDTSMTEFAKAMYEPLDGAPTDAVAHFDTNNVQKTVPATTTGIGDRAQLTQPLARVATEPNKVVNTAAPTEITVDLAKRALNGDQQAVIEFMKSARPSGVPVTLTEALQKIH